MYFYALAHLFVGLVTLNPKSGLGPRAQGGVGPREFRQCFRLYCVTAWKLVASTALTL